MSAIYKIIGADGKEYGSLTVEKLKQWISEGRLNRQSSVKAEDDADWKPLDSLPELAGAFTPPRFAPSSPAPAGGGLNAVIPYRNPAALVAYYLAVFSIIPFIGIVLGITAFVLGIVALRFRRRNPVAGGSVHAWIGIVAGGLFGFGWLALVIAIIITALAKHH
jgi:GYF domain 2